METRLCSLEDALGPYPGRIPSRWRALRLLAVVCLSCGGLREFHASDDRVLRLDDGRGDLAGRGGRAAAPAARANCGRLQRRLLSRRLLRPLLLRSVFLQRVLRPLLHGVVSPLRAISLPARRVLRLQPELGIGAPRAQAARRAGLRGRVLRRDRRSVRRGVPAAGPADRGPRDRGVSPGPSSVPAAPPVPAGRALSLQGDPRAAAGGGARGAAAASLPRSAGST